MGLGFDVLLNYFDISIAVTQGEHNDMASLLYSVSAVILASLIAFQYFKKAQSWINTKRKAA
jgi:uncharacterized protein